MKNIQANGMKICRMALEFIFGMKIKENKNILEPGNL